MEDPKKFLSPSSPNNISPSGNNENVSEFKRNSEQRNKKSFMEPTISAASKSITPNKKKILAERKPPKMGTIPDSNPRKSVSKIPSFSEEESFLSDSSANSTTTLPYDPLTNYLSPRPKFLRYNPNRKRKIVIRRERESGSSSSSGSTLTVSPKRVSLDSESSCNVVENEGNLDQEIEEEVEEEEEEMGLKWVLLKWVFVISGLIFCTMYISTMNNSAAIYSEKIECQDFWNLTSGIVALRSTDSGGYWVSEFDAESEIPRESFGRFEENQVPFKPEEQNLNVEFNSEIDFSEDFRVLEGIDQNKDFDGISTEKIVDSKPFKSEEEKLSVEFNSERDYSENFGVLRAFPKIKDYDDALPEKIVETAESKNEVKNLASNASTITFPVPNLVDLEERVHFLTENEVEFLDEIDGIKKVIFDEIDGIKEINFDEMDWAKKVIIWILRFIALILVLMVLVLFYKCKKAFTKATASNRMRNSSAPVMEERDESFMNPEAVVTEYMPVGSVEFKEEKVKNSPPPRRILKVKQLGEIEFGGESSGIVQRRGDSVFAVTDLRKTKKSKLSGTSESATQEDVKEEGGGTSVRRSQRLRDKGIASP